MKEIITKELLNEVLGYIPYKIDSIKPVSGVGLTLVLLNKDNTVKSYQNIYELAHKCKEWAFVYNDFILQSAFIPKGKFTSCYCIAEKNFSYPTLKETFHSDTEPEAIFKACQWILDNKDKS